jgi:4,5-DOPA dioxygenase extradiol
MGETIEARAPKPMPAVFFGHGSPMNALETNRYTTAWRAFGEMVRWSCWLIVF